MGRFDPDSEVRRLVLVLVVVLVLDLLAGEKGVRSPRRDFVPPRVPIYAIDFVHVALLLITSFLEPPKATSDFRLNGPPIRKGRVSGF